MSLKNCQIGDLDTMALGRIKPPPQSLTIRLKVLIKRHLSYQSIRKINDLRQRLRLWLTPSAAQDRAGYLQSLDIPLDLQAGDLVRIRPEGDIRATLDEMNMLNGCTFMAEMAEYCGTQQSVFKTVNRFLDERDYRVKSVRGVVLLEDVICEGTARFGSCDRSCFFFWRVEWLEKLDRPA